MTSPPSPLRLRPRATRATLPAHFAPDKGLRSSPARPPARSLTSVWLQDSMGTSGRVTTPSTSTMDSLGIWDAYLTMPLLTVVSSVNSTACVWCHGAKRGPRGRASECVRVPDTGGACAMCAVLPLYRLPSARGCVCTSASRFGGRGVCGGVCVGGAGGGKRTMCTLAPHTCIKPHLHSGRPLAQHQERRLALAARVVQAAAHQDLNEPRVGWLGLRSGQNERASGGHGHGGPAPAPAPAPGLRGPGGCRARPAAALAKWPGNKLRAGRWWWRCR